MSDHPTPDELRARLEHWERHIGVPVGFAALLDEAIAALETAERERDAALAAYEDERNRSTTIAQAERERDEARDALAACEASKADEERANAGLVAEVARLRAEYRRLEDEGGNTVLAERLQKAIDRALGDG